MFLQQIQFLCNIFHFNQDNSNVFFYTSYTYFVLLELYNKLILNLQTKNR